MPQTPASYGSPWVAGIGDALSTAGQLALQMAAGKTQQQQLAAANALKQQELQRQDQKDQIDALYKMLTEQRAESGEARAADAATQAANDAQYGQLSGQVKGLQPDQAAGNDLLSLINNSPYAPTKALGDTLQARASGGVGPAGGAGSMGLFGGVPNITPVTGGLFRQQTPAEAAQARVAALPPGQLPDVRDLLAMGKTPGEWEGPKPPLEWSATGPAGPSGTPGHMVPSTPGAVVNRPPPFALNPDKPAAPANETQVKAGASVQSLQDMEPAIQTAETQGGIDPAKIQSIIKGTPPTTLGFTSLGSLFGQPSEQEQAYAQLIRNYATAVGKTPEDVLGSFSLGVKGNVAAAAQARAAAVRAAQQEMLKKTIAPQAPLMPSQTPGGTPPPGAFDPSRIR